MHPFFRHLRLTIATLSCCVLTATVWAAPAKPQLQVTGYVINVELDPAANKLSATAVVSFTALEDLTAPVFELNNGLQITKVTDASKKPLEAERLTSNSTVRFNLATPIPKGTSTSFTFEYAGVLKGSETSPVEGIELASVEEPISILLYPGRWFPMVGLFTNRFTAEMHIRVPGNKRVVGSGATGAEEPTGQPDGVHASTGASLGSQATIVAGKFLEPTVVATCESMSRRRKDVAHDFADRPSVSSSSCPTPLGSPRRPSINLVELPDDSVSAA